jgi:hypothetical protein
MGMKRMLDIAEAQALAYKAGGRAFDGLTKSDRERLFDMVEAIARGRVTFGTPDAMPTLRGTVGAPGAVALQSDPLEHLRAPILQEACVREYLGLYTDRVRQRAAALPEKPQPAAREAGRDENPWPLGE